MSGAGGTSGSAASAPQRQKDEGPARPPPSRQKDEGPARPSPSRERIARALLIAAVVGLVVAAASFRVVAAGEREIAESTAALRAGDAHAAALHARRAAGWYAPGAPHVRVAYVRLIALATRAEGLGDRELSLFAWDSVRTAAIETRWLVTPHEEDLEQANQAIARISALAPRPPGTQTEPTQVVERQQMEDLLRDELPRAPWVVTLACAFLAWIGGAIWLSRVAVTVTGRVDLRRALPGLVVTALGIGAWLIAIWRA